MIDYKQITIKPSKNDKIFTRTYTYRASEDDSKNNARVKAIAQIKILLTQEIGTHIESYLEIKKKNINGVYYKYVKQEIQNLSAGITKVKVLQEKWNGKTYYIKANVRVNEKRTMELLLQSIKARSSQKDVKRLNKILAEQKNLLNKQDSKVQSINKKLISQEIINEAINNEVLNMKKKLIEYNEQEIAQNKEAKKQLSELEKIKAKIRQSKQKIQKEGKKACLMEVGMTKKNIEGIIGLPQGVDDDDGYGILCNSERYFPHKDRCTRWYYGNIELRFKPNGLLKNKYGC